MRLEDGTDVSVADLVAKGKGFDDDEIAAALDAQLAIMRNVLPLHRRLADSGRLEVSVSPFYHPILPLVADTGRANIDAPGSRLPGRFSWPEDAQAQIERAAAFHAERFGARPKGMWPSEGSVGEHVVPLVAGAGFSWMATDQGVLARSGKWGYRTDDPEVLLKPYVAGAPGSEVSVFFRHTQLSNDIGFTMQRYDDYDRAAADYVELAPRRVRPQGEVPGRPDTPDHPRRRERLGLVPRVRPRVPERPLPSSERRPGARGRVVLRVHRGQPGARGAAASRLRAGPRLAALLRELDRRDGLGPRERPQHLDRRGRGEPRVGPPRGRATPPRDLGRDAREPPGGVRGPLRGRGKRLVLVVRRRLHASGRRRLDVRLALPRAAEGRVSLSGMHSARGARVAHRPPLRPLDGRVAHRGGPGGPEAQDHRRRARIPALERERLGLLRGARTRAGRRRDGAPDRLRVDDRAVRSRTSRASSSPCARLPRRSGASATRCS